jgi:NADH dehydrogenase FAD-containing subunit
MKEILLIGNGWAGSSFLKHIDNRKYKVTVISPNKEFIYTPLLVSSIFKNINLKYDINNLGEIEYNKGIVESINFEEKYVKINKIDTNIKYDYLVLAHGCEVNTFNIEGVKENCYFINYENINLIKNKMSSLKENSNIVIIGCGLTGSDLIGKFIDKNKYNIHAVDGLQNPLSMFNKKLYTYTKNLWEKKKVNTYFGNFVKKIDSNKVFFNNSFINYDMVFWCGGIRPNLLSKKINNSLLLDCRFGIPVDGKLKVKKTENVFAIGDCGYNKLPPTAQVAYQEGKYLANNFNNNFNKVKDFNFNNKGQICYIGNGESVYQNQNFYFKGKLMGYFNNIIHIYNGIDFKQKIDFFKDIFNLR